MAPSPPHIILLLEQAAEKAAEGKGVLVYKTFDSNSAKSPAHDFGFGLKSEGETSTLHRPTRFSLNATTNNSNSRTFDIRPPSNNKENVRPKTLNVDLEERFPVQNGQTFDFGPNSLGDRYLPVPIGFGFQSLSERLPRPTPRPDMLSLELELSRSNTFYMSYQTLLEQAQLRSKAVNGLMVHQGNKIVLLHVDNHLQGIVWFWAVVAAGGIPCLSTPFNPDPNIRRKQVRNLEHKLTRPAIITTRKLEHEFEDESIPCIVIEDFEEFGHNRDFFERKAYSDDIRKTLKGNGNEEGEDLAILMLTSGSTGDSKAVRLTHVQILCSLHGKAWKHKTTVEDVFLSWTGLDHVANLLEIHMHAMSKRASQIHVPGPEVLQNPMYFLKAVDQHRVSYTFAPNFFLYRLVQELNCMTQVSFRDSGNFSLPDIKDGQSPKEQPDSDTLSFTSSPTYPTNPDFDLSSLRCLISGGESNVVTTCVELTRSLRRYGAPASFIRPGFGMTETCAGSIYNKDCPNYDASLNKEFASLGKPIIGLDMRITEDGELQLQGPVLFDGYHNEPQASKDCRTEDGWFHTYDQGHIDEKGVLHLTGRTKDMVIVNGINYHLQAIEVVIEEAQIPGIVPTYIVVFAFRPEGSETEKLVVVFLPAYETSDSEARHNTATAISKAIITYCNVRPYLILPLDESLLQKSTLGKFSRPKLRQCLLDGTYDSYIKTDQQLLSEYRTRIYQPATNKIEQNIIAAYHAIFKDGIMHDVSISRNDNLFSLGFSSIDLLKLKKHLQFTLSIPNIPIATFFSSPTVSALASALLSLQAPKKTEYDPIVVLQTHGTGIPLFFIHPGVGEVLVFMALSRYITDRPVYALRARGFDGEPFFTSFDEVVDTYHAAIKRVQPHGPYVLIGYSFGAIVTFEITKIMESAGDEIRFLGTFDQPPYFKERARGYDWYECILTIAFFLKLIPEDYAYRVLPEMRQYTHDEVLDHILSLAPKTRLAELALTRGGLNNWANLALGLKKLAVDFDPEGSVSKMDVFYTEPLTGLVKARSKEEWLRDFIGKWESFVEEPERGEARGRGDRGIRFHDVGGTHRTMISVPHVKTFWGVLKKAMRDRGV